MSKELTKKINKKRRYKISDFIRKKQIERSKEESQKSKKLKEGGRMKLCKQCKRELLKELKDNPKWQMTYGIPAFQIVGEFVKLIEEAGGK